jgi:Holliday junction resolvasome RuvABC endonuclease subunit
MEKLTIIREEKKDNYIALAIDPNFPMPSEMRVGIDPGTKNLGIAVIKPEIEFVTLYRCTLKRHKKALLRLLDVQQVLGDMVGHFTPNSKAIIEGASYGNFYRQVEMAEQRAGMLLWFYKYGIEAELIPPLIWLC